jgi:alanine racemase
VTTSPGNLARPGIALHGVVGQGQVALRPSVAVRARVVDLRDLTAGDTVGYGATWTAPAPRRIATVAIGYGDGYRRSLSNRGEGMLRGVRCPVVGRVSMDMTLFDVTDVPCERGDVMTLAGRDFSASADDLAAGEIRAESVAATGDLSVYELLVGWRLRLPRVYYGAFSGMV